MSRFPPSLLFSNRLFCVWAVLFLIYTCRRPIKLNWTLYWEHKGHESIHVPASCGKNYSTSHHWKLRVFMMPTLSLLAAPQVIVTTCGATNDNKVGILMTHFVVTGSTTGCYDNLWCYQWQQSWHLNDSVFGVKYAHNFVVLCFVVVISSVFFYLFLFTYISQGFIIANGAIISLA